LLMSVKRDSTAPRSDYDLWHIDSVSLTTHERRPLVIGYGVTILGFRGNPAELAITYYDCWECEAATLFTTFQFQKGKGWRARWPSQKNGNTRRRQPGALVKATDLGEPYTDEKVEQVFAVISSDGQNPGNWSAGSWFHSRSPSGKVSDDVHHYWIDPTTHEDRDNALNGAAALQFERAICNPGKISRPNVGQDSRLCRDVRRLRKPVTAPQPQH